MTSMADEQQFSGAEVAAATLGTYLELYCLFRSCFCFLDPRPFEVIFEAEPSGVLPNYFGE